MLDFLDDSSEFRNLSDDILIASFDIFDIGDESLTTCDHGREDHRHSGSEIPTGDRGSLQMCPSKYECLMRIHDRNMSLHLLDLDEPIEPSFEEDFMDTRHAISLREEEGKRRLKISRESRIYIGLEIGRFEARSGIVYRDDILLSIE